MTSDHRQLLAHAVMRLLRPLVRLLLRNGIPYGTFAEWAKWVYIDVAGQEFPPPGRKQTNSRIATITGLSRKEVLRVQRLPCPDLQAEDDRYNRAARVISGWRRDHRFADAKGNPATLSVEGEGRSFSALVKHHSGDMPYRAVLDELERVGAVKRTDEGEVELVMQAYVPQTGEAEKLAILGSDVALLLQTIDHNLGTDGQPRYQRKVLYNNLPAEVLPRFRRLSAERSQALLEELDEWLAAHDRDSNPQVDGSGSKLAGVGIYYFEDDSDRRQHEE